MDTLLSIIANIFSSFLYDKVGIWKDKKSIAKFKESLANWAIEFEKKNDGTIVTTGRFYTYIKSHRVILNVFEYVTDVSEKSVSEEAFILALKKRLILAMEQDQRLAYHDKQVINEFCDALLDKSKKYVYGNLQSQDRALFYLMVQTKTDVQSILHKFDFTEKELSAIKAEIQRIHLLLFDKKNFLLADEWFIHQNIEQIKNLGDRYIPDLHIPIDTSLIFDSVTKNTKFYNRLKYKSDEFLIKLKSPELDEINDISNSITKLLTSVLSNPLSDIDIRCLISMLNEAENILDKALSSLYDKKDKDDNNNIDHQIYLIQKALNSVVDYLDYICSSEVKASIVPYVLLDGEGGTGKSHIIADAVSNRMADGNKSILLLGQHFKGMVPPLQEMMNLININKAPDEFLSYLNSVAQEQKMRIIIFIDALNEGNGKTIWKNYLAAIIEKFKSFSWLGFVASIRSEYIDFVFEDNRNLRDELVCVTHNGFGMVEYEATKKYFDFYGITYSEVPLANHEFQNPLFLRLFCEGYRKQIVQFNNIKYSDVYKNYIDTINIKISNICGFNRRYPVVYEVLNKIVEYKYDNNDNNFIPFDALSDIILSIQTKYACKDDLLGQLLSEGIVTQNVNYDGQEYIYVTYERLEDFLYSNKLLQEITRIGKDDFVNKHKNVIYKRSILGCLAIALAEEIETEIFEIFAPDNRNVKYAFVENLKWRRAQSITEKTKEYINTYVISDSYEVQHLFDTLILIATKENFPLNGYCTVDFISKISMSDRDAFFIPLFNDIYENEGSSINRLLDWCVLSSSKSSYSEGFIKLAALTVSTFLISSNLHLRDKATKALSVLLKNHTEIMISTLKYFEDIDDPYIVERLYAVAFACAVSEQNDSKLLSLVEYVYEAVFNQEFVYPNILLRDYAKNIIDYANYKLKSLDINLDKVSPPYKTVFPDIPSDETINMYKYDYKDSGFKDSYWGQNAILSSMKVEYSRDGKPGGYGDFGRYVFQRYFSAWKQLDPNDLRNIAIKRIFDLGYNVEKHGKFDRRISGGRGGYKKSERIGKKYQWIALYELAAQVADNFQLQIYTDDHGGKMKAYCLGSFEPNIRRIDPTVSLPEPQQDDMRDRLIHDAIYTIPCQDHHTWLADFNDLPTIKEMLQIVYDHKEYLLLNGWYSWSENKALGDKKYQTPLKDIWVQINSYIVKQDQFEKYIETLSEADFMGRWAAEPNDNYQLFNKEYYWSEGYRFFQNPYYCGEEWVNIDTHYGEYSEVLEKVLVPSFRYLSERSGDTLGDGSISWYKPCGEIFNALQLVYGKENTVLYDRSGYIVCFDSNELLREEIGFFMDANVFREFLKEKGYAVFWTILAEKRILQESLSNYKMEFSMPHISGLFYYGSSGDLIQTIKHFDN
ncbi:hypothetical protein [Propionispora vibrioides]|uniref:ATP-binding protein n=1 Tax=Propionispora vibrioides TaxID=112903 RepID=A0A1H8Y717_9FIRM|nr:hypothetical protein [Propionispora vibrioides]SEP47308.1 hypothetical protein SAMN04490178_1443 [Propionispora vibrioides]